MKSNKSGFHKEPSTSSPESSPESVNLQSECAPNKKRSFSEFTFYEQGILEIFLVFINNKLPFSTLLKRNPNLFVFFRSSRRVKVLWLCVTIRFRCVNHLVTSDQHIVSKRQIVKKIASAEEISCMLALFDTKSLDDNTKSSFHKEN